MKTKHCTKCKKQKPLSEFYKDKRFKVGRQSHCKSCKTKYQKEYRDAAHNRNTVLKKKYGITFEEYDKINKKQKGLCAICGLPEKSRNRYGKKRLAVDHNHQTNKVRGLLCRNCNLGIGLLNVDNFGILNFQKVIEYLEVNE